MEEKKLARLKRVGYAFSRRLWEHFSLPSRAVMTKRTVLIRNPVIFLVCILILISCEQFREIPAVGTYNSG